LQKGEEVKVKGELRSSSWETPSGEKRIKHTIVAESIEKATDGIQKDIDIDNMPF
jgi:single-stranded DNA-binding protein